MAKQLRDASGIGDHRAGGGETLTTIRPDVLTALLTELARAPAAAGWELPPAPGDTVGRFEILREIGRGGFGVVYEAKDNELGRSVAFKAIRAAATEGARDARHLAEAEAAARLAHSNIVHLYDLGRCEQGAYLILELLRGETLAERLAKGPLPVREVVRVAVEISRGLAHAHSQGVIHRDLKPSNVFVCDDGQVKVLDFGLAEVFGKAAIAGGTPAYMAPEQASGEAGDARVDVYSLGVILFELLSGRRPFEGGEWGIPAGGKAQELAGARPVLAKLVGRMLRRDPTERPANGAEAHEQLAAIQKSLEPRRLAATAWAVAALALVFAIGFGLRSRPLPPGRLLVAMADTENGTGDPDLDGVSELLRSALDQSKRVSIIARSRLVNVLREAGSLPPSIDEPKARQAAQRAQAQLLIVVAVRLGDREYDVSVRALDLSRGETAFTVRENTVTKLGLREMVDRLSAKVRRELGEHAAESAAPAVAVTDLAPARADAWAHYAKGQRLESEGRNEEARDAYLLAVTSEPDFPLPRLALIDLPGWKGVSVDSYDEHLASLRKNFDRLPPQDRAYAEAALFGADEWDYAEGAARFERAMERWPEDPRPYRALVGMTLAYRADFERVRRYVEKALAVAPLGNDEIIEYLVLLDRLDEALARARRWTEVSPGEDSFAVLSKVHRTRSEPKAALEAARRCMSLGACQDIPMDVFVEGEAIDEYEAVLERSGKLPWRWLALRGRWREAHAALPAERSAYPVYDARLLWPPDRALLAIQHGVTSALWREVVQQFQTGYPFTVCNAWPLAILGDLEHAEHLANIFYPGDGHFTCVRMYNLVRRWKTGDREEALRGLAGLYMASSDLYRGEILTELGRDREAVDSFRLYRRAAKREVFDGWVRLSGYPRSLYLEAAALDRLHDGPEALALLNRLLHLWERAEPDTLLLAQARSLQNRLAQDIHRKPQAMPAKR